MNLQKIQLALLSVIAVIVVIMGLMFANILKAVKLNNLPYCSVDVGTLTDQYIIHKALDENVKGKDKKKVAKELVLKLEKLLKNPYQYGCKAIFWKGAILSKSVDITDKVGQELVNYLPIN